MCLSICVCVSLPSGCVRSYACKGEEEEQDSIQGNPSCCRRPIRTAPFQPVLSPEQGAARPQIADPIESFLSIFIHFIRNIRFLERNNVDSFVVFSRSITSIPLERRHYMHTVGCLPLFEFHHTVSFYYLA